MSGTAEAEAQRLLDTVWADLSPHRLVPVDPILISHALGIDVYDADLEPSVSGMLIKKKGGDPRIVLSRKDHPNRSRFTCAHEVGHYLRRARQGNDDEYESVDYRGPLSAAGQDPDEIFANQFAAALLMPAAEVKQRVADGATVGQMAWEFKVSADAMGFRLQNLGLA